MTRPCHRCGRDFDRAALRPPSAFLRALAAPFFLPMLLRSRALRREAVALYCRPCRRQLNVSFLFIAFLVVDVTVAFVLQELGLVGVAPR